MFLQNPQACKCCESGVSWHELTHRCVKLNWDVRLISLSNENTSCLTTLSSVMVLFADWTHLVLSLLWRETWWIQFNIPSDRNTDTLQLCWLSLTLSFISAEWRWSLLPLVLLRLSLQLCGRCVSWWRHDYRWVLSSALLVTAGKHWLHLQRDSSFKMFHLYRFKFCTQTQHYINDRGHNS